MRQGEHGFVFGEHEIVNGKAFDPLTGQWQFTTDLQCDDEQWFVRRVIEKPNIAIIYLFRGYWYVQYAVDMDGLDHYLDHYFDPQWVLVAAIADMRAKMNQRQE